MRDEHETQRPNSRVDVILDLIDRTLAEYDEAVSQHGFLLAPAA